LLKAEKKVCNYKIQQRKYTATIAKIEKQNIIAREIKQRD